MAKKKRPRTPRATASKSSRPARKSKRVAQQVRPPKKKAVLLVTVKKEKPAKKKVGRPKGSKDSIPRSAKSTFKAVCEEIRDKSGRTIEQAMLDGLRGGPAYADKYLKLYRDSIDGPPATNVNVSQTFREDELATASRDLQRKMASLVRVAVAQAGKTPEGAAGVSVTPTASGGDVARDEERPSAAGNAGESSGVDG